MDKYKSLMCVKGLIISLDEQLYKLYQGKELNDTIQNKIVEEYYNAIYDFLTKEDTNENA